jgi:hypothetical protein
MLLVTVVGRKFKGQRIMRVERSGFFTAITLVRAAIRTSEVLAFYAASTACSALAEGHSDAKGDAESMLYKQLPLIIGMAAVAATNRLGGWVEDWMQCNDKER